MPRYYRRRYTRTLVKPKKKWASNLVNISVDNNNTTTNSALAVVVCGNATQTSLPTPVIVKTGNFKVQVDAIATPQNPQDLITSTAYLLYVPQGLVPTGGYSANYTAYQQIIENHPEWIMAWKMIASDSLLSPAQPSSFDRVQFSTRLKRNLNSGDSIVFVLMATGDTSRVAVLGKVQFWTCAN